MIKRYSDHAANERTFLAWVRTAVAIMAFGFVIEKFDLFLVALAPQAALKQIAHTARSSPTRRGSPSSPSGW
jgi:putative membrane protein